MSDFNKIIKYVLLIANHGCPFHSLFLRCIQPNPCFNPWLAFIGIRVIASIHFSLYIFFYLMFYPNWMWQILGFQSMVEHRPLIAPSNQIRFWVCISMQFISIYILILLSLFLLPFLFPLEFHVNAWLVMGCVGFLEVQSFQLQLLLLIWCSNGSWFVLSNSSSLLIVSGHILRIHPRHICTGLIFELVHNSSLICERMYFS